MMRTDTSTLARYIAILGNLTAAPPVEKQESSGVPHRRAIHHALELFVAAQAEGQADQPLTGNALADLVPPFSAARGETIAAAVLRAVAARRSPIAPPVRSNIEQALEAFIGAQQPSGEFLLATQSDNPEPHWYHELVILHAISAYALISRHGETWQAVDRAAEFHLNETQPDHATTEPWALFAFLRHPDTLPLADQLLHAVQAQHPHGLDRISWMLLSDALYSLHRCQP